MYAALGKPFSVNSNLGSIPVHSATCMRIETVCPYTGGQLAFLNTKEN